MLSVLLPPEVKDEEDTSNYSEPRWLSGRLCFSFFCSRFASRLFLTTGTYLGDGGSDTTTDSESSSLQLLSESILVTVIFFCSALDG
jgi:hypothetical protein